MDTESKDTKETFVPAPDSTLAEALAAAGHEGEVENDMPVAAPEDAVGSTAEGSEDEGYRITQKAIEMLRSVYDPEIPVNVYDLGLIYKIDFTPEDRVLHVDMTLTAPGCPAADFIFEDVRQKLLSVEGPKAVDLRLVFEPEWNQDMMSEEAKLELNFL